MKRLSIASSGVVNMPTWIVKLQNLEYLHLDLKAGTNEDYILVNQLPKLKVWDLREGISGKCDWPERPAGISAHIKVIPFDT